MTPRRPPRVRLLPAILWLAFVAIIVALYAFGVLETPKDPPPSPPCFDDRANPICDRVPNG
jgi:hypothetical protein